MDTLDDELWGLFVDEATSGLQSLGESVERMRRGEAGDVIRSALRVVHNIKGAARVAGAPSMERVAHAFEDALADPHNQGAPVPPLICAQLEQALGLMAAILASPLVDPGVEPFVSAVRAARASPSVIQQSPAPAGAKEPAADPAPARPSDPPMASPEATAMVRLEAARLDELMRFTDGLLLLHSRFNVRQEALDAAVGSLEALKRRARGEERSAIAALERDFNDIAAANQADIEQLGHWIGDWSLSIKRARMLPLAGVVARWRLTVTDAAHRLGKEARFSADVGDIEIDRSILDGLLDPIMHVLRNAVDHGIEPPDAREAAGKPRAGLITLRARATGPNIEIEIDDDGRGIDPRILGKKAVERGLIDRTQLARMSEEAIVDLVFLSGLSTAASVSEVSGRGVGLDVARRRLADLGGRARAGRSALGGASFRLQAPATIVSTRGLLIGTPKVAYVVPTASIQRTLRIDTADVRIVEGAAAARVDDGEVVKLRWLASLMREPRPDDPDKLLVIVITDGDARVGLVVQRLMGEVEFVTKRLPRTLPAVRGVSGGMVLSDGSVGLVLDVQALLRDVREGGGAGGGATDARPQIAAAARRRRILAVDDSLTSRALVRNILVNAGYDVDTATDGEAAWRALSANVYDLVISDIQMPNLDGLELTRRMRENEKTRATPLILVTSLDSPGDLAAGARAGADEYIVKGQFDQQQLLKAVARLI